MFEETARQNMALFEQAMKVFSPVGGIYPQAASRTPTDSEPEDIIALKAQLAALQRQLNKLEKKS
jgi:polyhydroxyalkanoate synthesis regulator protein